MDQVCTVARVRARRAFVISPYRVVAGGRLTPDLPGRCLDAGEGVCRICVDHWRPRKTGPCFALCVVECVTHGRRFTLYPPGHVPYGGVAVAPVASDGHLLRDAEEGGRAWDLTLFRAARDAARAIGWPRALAPGDGERGQESLRTQRRRIVLAASLLGVLAEPRRMQPAVAAALGIPTLVVRDAAAAFRTPGWPPYAARGRALGPVLDAVAPDCVLERLLAASVLIDVWGPGHRWDPERAVLCVRGPP